MSKINEDIRGRVVKAMDEMNEIIQGRVGVIHGAWVGRIAGLHMIQKGPGGTGKSMLSRAMVEHIADAKHFESALDETTDPSAVFGSPNIKVMAETGRTCHVTTDMLPEATDAFLDEFFNANIPMLHSLQPVLNERIFHDGAGTIAVPLRQCLMGTNKLNLDPDVAPLFDRVHLRFEVNYLTSREQKMNMVSQAIARLARADRRGTATSLDANVTTVTVAELDQAFKESLDLNVEDGTYALFFDLLEELEGQGISVSDRRKTDGFNAVLANAWLRGHETIQAGDMDILANMFWNHEDQISEARKVILSVTSPGDKVALDLLDALDELKKEVREAQADDEERGRRVCIEAVRNSEKLLKEAEKAREDTLAAGGSTQRLDELINQADTFKIKVAQDVFGISQSDMQRVAAGA